MVWAQNIMHLLLWLFLVGNGAMVYRRALAMFNADDTSADQWVGLSLAAVFLIGFSVVVYSLGGQGIAYIVALTQ